jgi:hypothetical protein
VGQFEINHPSGAKQVAEKVPLKSLFLHRGLI